MVDTDWERRSAAHTAAHALPCDKCRLPYARVQNGCLVIESRHHGEIHTNAIPLAQVRALLEAALTSPAVVE